MALSRERVHAVSRAAQAEVAVWVLDVEVVDMRRVPESTDFMATYRVHLDDADNVLELRRVRRYVRAWVGDDR
jgi:hypothetical protein